MGSVRRRPAPRGLALACALLLAAACQPGTAGDEPEEATEAPPAAETEGQDDPGDESDEAEEEEDEPPRASGGGDLREPLTLDIQQTHAGGTVVRILGARFPSNAIELEVEILNGAPRQVHLHHETHPPYQMVVEDDRGNRYPPNPPADNETVTVDQGQRLQGTLTFLGRVDPAATELTLHTSGGYDGEPGEQNPLLDRVSMSIDIPLGDG